MSAHDSCVDDASPADPASQQLLAILVEAIEDEYKARATYRRVIARFGPVRPFLRILESEQRHIDALSGLFKRHGLPIPADDWEEMVEVPQSLQEACRAGVVAEIENAAMVDRLLDQSRAYPDVQRVLANLRRASQQNHLAAFRRCAEREPEAGREATGEGRGCGSSGDSGHRHRRGRTGRGILRSGCGVGLR